MKKISLQLKLSIVIIVLILIWIFSGIISPKDVIDNSVKFGGGDIIIPVKKFYPENTFKTVFGYGRVDKGQINIFSEVNSHIVKINFNEGDKVKKGDKIIELLNGIFIPAPIAGTLDEINIKTGDIVFAGQTKLFSIISNSVNDAIINIPASEARLVKKNQEVILEIEDKKLNGIVYFVSQVSNKATNTFQVKIKITNSTTNLFQDETIKISIKTKKLNGIFVPTSSVSVNQDGSLNITIITDEGEVVKMPIEILNMEKDGTWVSGDFKKSINVALKGSDFVKDGEKVKYEFQD